MQRALQELGWQGIEIDVHSDWSVVAFGGDYRAGSLRIDSGLGDEAAGASGIELRWSVAKGKLTEDMLEARVAPLIAAAKKHARKQGVESISSVQPLDQFAQSRDAAVAFRWTAQSAASGRIWHCQVCGRIVVAQVYGGAGQNFNRESKLLLDSIRCHSTVDGVRKWGLYGLLINVPSDFTLIQQQLMNVYLMLKFQRGNSLDQLVVEQWSLANVQLKGSYLDEWYDRKSAGSMEGVNSVKEESEVHGHPALKITGKRDSLGYKLLDVPRQLAKFKRPASEYSALLWECPESNRAYLTQSFTRKLEPSLVASCAESTVCHGRSSTKEGV